MEITLLTSSQRKQIANNNREIEQIRELIGFTVKVGPQAKRNKKEKGLLIGWSFNESGGVDYVIRLYKDDECICVSKEDFQQEGYTFIG